MDANDGTLCLEDIRGLQLKVNELLRWVRVSCPRTLPISPPSSHSPESDLGSKLDAITSMLTLMSSPTPPTQMKSLDTTPKSAEMVSLVDDDPLELLRHHAVSANLLVSSLGVWLAITLLCLTWMRLTDLQYSPKVVRNFCF